MQHIPEQLRTKHQDFINTIDRYKKRHRVVIKLRKPSKPNKPSKWSNT